MQRTVLQLRERDDNLTVLFQCLGKKYQLKKEFKNMSFHGAKVLYEKPNCADEFEAQS